MTSCRQLPSADEAIATTGAGQVCLGTLIEVEQRGGDRMTPVPRPAGTSPDGRLGFPRQRVTG
ncbi:hypothetical protein BN11_110012 [Nostocoides australiense Ben110]|uniref:Uncharacterized protein n=1 Tax=Nostocoides australiense Ben110 TaxID=1193182 RepID=W6JSX5_9MICO|nr:hypothetical protein BN11_110012 [Tetrasphaera australiensis Ben110]